MQLFISDQYSRTGDQLIIYEERIVHQCSRVLRMRPGDRIQIQNNDQRLTIEITNFNKKEIQGTVIEIQSLNSPITQKSIAIALPNRREKAELMVQKITEIGINHIIFRPAQRSVFKSIPDKKLQRLQSIALEASEQSFRTSLPTVSFLDKRDEKSILSYDEIFYFHQDGNTSPTSGDNNQKQSHLGIIGPEGGFTSKEVDFFSYYSKKITLGSTVLRMETAAIIGARILQNL